MKGQQTELECAGCQNLRLHLVDLERRLEALEHPHEASPPSSAVPRLRLVCEDSSPAVRQPVWMPLPRSGSRAASNVPAAAGSRRVRIDSSHSLPEPHLFLIPRRIQAQLGPASYRLADFLQAGSEPTQSALVDRVA